MSDRNTNPFEIDFDSYILQSEPSERESIEDGAESPKKWPEKPKVARKGPADNKCCLQTGAAIGRL